MEMKVNTLYLALDEYQNTLEELFLLRAKVNSMNIERMELMNAVREIVRKEAREAGKEQKYVMVKTDVLCNLVGYDREDDLVYQGIIAGETEPLPEGETDEGYQE